MTVTVTRQWVGGGPRHHHYDTVEEAAADTREYIERLVGPDLDPQGLEEITRNVIDRHCVRLDTRDGGIIVGPGTPA